jgi:hypothetical protein
MSRQDPVAWAERRAPHAPQVEIVLRAGSVHGREPDACVACHMAGDDPAVGRHSFATRFADGRPSPAACTACHEGATGLDDYLALGDWDGDGLREPHVEEVEGLLGQLEDRLASRVSALPPAGCGPSSAVLVGAPADRVVLVDADGRDVGDCDGDGVLDEGEEPALVEDDVLYGAAVAWLEALADGSRGLHDPRGQVRDLQDAIVRVIDGPRPPWDRPVF